MKMQDLFSGCNRAFRSSEPTFETRLLYAELASPYDCYCDSKWGYIDASKEFKPGKVQNELSDENIQKIVDAYLGRKDIDNYAHVASMDEIIENGYNLNMPRYITTSEKVEEINISQVKTELAEITAKKMAAIDKVNSTMKMLGL